jgi:hypothetical protein
MGLPFIESQQLPAILYRMTPDLSHQGGFIIISVSSEEDTEVSMQLVPLTQPAEGRVGRGTQICQDSEVRMFSESLFPHATSFTEGLGENDLGI